MNGASRAARTNIAPPVFSSFVLKMSGALSQRIGHSDVAFTMKQYVQADLEADRQVATTLAELIIGGSLASMEIGTSQGAA